MPSFVSATFFALAACPAAGVRVSRPASSVPQSRREAVRGAALAAAAALVGASAPAFAEKSKGYMTMDEYNKLKAREAKDQRLYGQFEALRTRASQTSEFNKLVRSSQQSRPTHSTPEIAVREPFCQAESGDFSKLSELSRGWEATIRKELLEAAAKELEGEAKQKGQDINKLVLADLKGIDKLVSPHPPRSPPSPPSPPAATARAHGAHDGGLRGVGRWGVIPPHLSRRPRRAPATRCRRRARRCDSTSSTSWPWSRSGCRTLLGLATCEFPVPRTKPICDTSGEVLAVGDAPINPPDLGQKLDISSHACTFSERFSPAQRSHKKKTPR